jgi:hypothetical protein
LESPSDSDRDCIQGHKKLAWRFRELKVSALSVEEWNYIRGLFLADGSSGVEQGKQGSRVYRVRFFLGGGFREEVLICKVVSLMIRAGLAPKIRKDKRTNMKIVYVCSKSLFAFLPDKAALRDDIERRKAFFKENNLENVRHGIAFAAGLLDGDGYCDVHVNKKRCTFGEVRCWRWVFAQSRYPFLIYYLKDLVESLAPRSVHTSVRTNGVYVINIRKSGIEAMLHAGIANYSWRVADWLRKVAETKSERMKYYTTGEVAGMLNTSRDTVRKWLRNGKMRYLRGPSKDSDVSQSYYYIPVDEAKRFSEKTKEENEHVLKLKSRGIKLVDIAKKFRIPHSTLRYWYQRGNLSYINQGRQSQISIGVSGGN